MEKTGEVEGEQRGWDTKCALQFSYRMRVECGRSVRCGQWGSIPPASVQHRH